MPDLIALGCVRLLGFVLGLLPLEGALAIGRGLGTLAFFLMAKRRRMAYVNLKAAFGERYTAAERTRIIKKHFQHLAQNMVEMFRFPRMGQSYLDRYIETDHWSRYTEIDRTGEGVILMTPHFGNWELTNIVASLTGHPMYILARRQKHSHLNTYLDRLRTSHGSEAVYKGEAGVRELLWALKKKMAVGVLGDLSGGRDGHLVRFFGRKTTAPAGIFKIARNTHSVVLPAFIVRTQGPRHKIFVQEPFFVEPGQEGDKAVSEALERYYRLLEHWISKYPDQWLWVYKRWKYCFTKRVLVLKDGRAGHTNQSEAVRQELERLGERLGDPYEFEFRSVDVHFKSARHRKLFSLFAPFFLPFAQGRLEMLRLFMEPGSVKALSHVHADLIISAGSSLAPLNLMLKKENTAKSILLMKPPFPYRHRQFDLLIVPAHDAFRHEGRHVLRTLVAPNRVDETLLRVSGEELKRALLGQANGTKRISIFIGGDSKSYRIEKGKFGEWLKAVKQFAAEKRLELLITTSRRTPPEMAQMVKSEFADDPACKLLVIANESNPDGVAYGMLALTETAIVTEDSISMVSEAVSAGKNVLVMRLGNGRLRPKHERFHKALVAQDLTQMADVSNFKDQLARLANGAGRAHLKERQSTQIQEALRGLL